MIYGVENKNYGLFRAIFIIDPKVRLNSIENCAF